MYHTAKESIWLCDPSSLFTFVTTTSPCTCTSKYKPNNYIILQVSSTPNTKVSTKPTLKMLTMFSQVLYHRQEESTSTGQMQKTSEREHAHTPNSIGSGVAAPKSGTRRPTRGKAGEHKPGGQWERGLANANQWGLVHANQGWWMWTQTWTSWTTAAAAAAMAVAAAAAVVIAMAMAVTRYKGSMGGPNKCGGVQMNTGDRLTVQTRCGGSVGDTNEPEGVWTSTRVYEQAPGYEWVQGGMNMVGAVVGAMCPWTWLFSSLGALCLFLSGSLSCLLLGSGPWFCLPGPGPSVLVPWFLWPRPHALLLPAW